MLMLMMKRALGVCLLAASTLLTAGCAAPAENDDETTQVDPVVVHVTPAAPSCPPYCPNPNAHEVRIAATVTNSSTKPTSVVTPLILDAIRAKLNAAGNIDVDEGSDPTNTNHALYLAPSLSPISYASGNLSVRVKLAVFTYPGLSLLGNIDKTLTAQGVTPPNVAMENQLISLAAGLAAQQFVQNISAFE